MVLKQVSGTTQLPPILPLDQQQPALDVKKIALLKEKAKQNIFEGPGIDGKIEIKNGSLFSFTQNISNTRVDASDKQHIKTVTEKKTIRYCDNDGNGTFETRIDEIRDANGNLIKTTKYGKSKDDNVSNYDIEIPLNGKAK